MELFRSRYMPCPNCGVSVEQSNSEHHVCDEDKILDYTAFLEAQNIENEIDEFFCSPEGRYAIWEAEQRRIEGV